MYWYNPATRSMEERMLPATDAAAYGILSRRKGAVEEYKRWRVTASIMQAMIFTGQAFQEKDAGRQPPR